MIDERLESIRITVVQKCRNRLNSTSILNTVELLRVLDRCGVERNEISDSLAKEGSIFRMQRSEVEEIKCR